jgi:hypothetical protein
MSSRLLNLRRADACCVCDTPLAAGTRAHWNAARRVVTCISCHDKTPVGHAARIAQRSAFDRGRAGASAQREHLRRQRGREARTRNSHPWIGELLLALRGTPQHERAFAQGSHGERAVGDSLDRRTAKSGTIVLHDRRMPGGHGNIDHIAVAPSGVYVIDAKAVRGKVRVSRPLLGKPRLLVAGRDRTKFAHGLDRQVAAVRAALARLGRADVAVEGVLCFTKADLPLLGSAPIRGHRLHYRRALERKLNRPGPLDGEAIDVLARGLAAEFPRA